MNAQALVGKVLGNCRLLKVIGRGSMGAVYLAQQTHAYDQGQVAVKVFLGASTLEPLQYMDFLVRFRHTRHSHVPVECGGGPARQPRPSHAGSAPENPCTAEVPGWMLLKIL